MTMATGTTEGREANGTGGSGGIISRHGAVLFRIVALSALLLLISQIAFAWFSLNEFEKVLRPQLERKAEVVGRAVGNLVRYSVDDLGFPPERLVGVDAYFTRIMHANPDIDFMALLDAGGGVLSLDGISAEDFTTIDLSEAVPGATVPSSASEHVAAPFPISVDGTVVATLIVGVSLEYVSDRLSDIYLDVITVIVVSWLVTLEFMLFFMNTKLTTPLNGISIALARGQKGVFADRVVSRARDEVGLVTASINDLIHALQQKYDDFRFELHEVRSAQLDKAVVQRVQAVKNRVDARLRFSGGEDIRPSSSLQIRIPLFLLMFSEELSRPFLPIFISRLVPAETTVSHEFMIGFPITLFMFVAAVLTPFGGVLSDRFGARRVFILGAIPATIGYFGTFLTQGYLDFIMWRTFSGVGYGLIFIAAQAWVAENTRGRHMAQEMSVFVGAVFVGMICGPPFGGIIAARLGYEATFLLSAGLAFVSGLIVYSMLDNSMGKRVRAGTRLGISGARMLLLDPRFFAVTFLAAVPGKFIVTGFFFYLLPLHLNAVGNSQSVIGWLMMLYGLSTFALLPLVSRFADRSGQYPVLVGLGVGLTGAGCLAILPELGIPNPNVAAAISILCLGVGHALSLPSQLAIIQQAAARFHGAVGPASAISAYRVIERLGLVMGPLVAAPLAIAFGTAGAIVGLGLITLAFVPFYAFAMYLSRNRPGAAMGELS